NPSLEPDDVALLEIIDKPKRYVSVKGQVVRSGILVELDDQTTIARLLELAGQPTQVAALTKAYVLRAGKQIPLNLRPFVTGKADDAVRKFKLEVDDEVVIPEIDTRYAVVGDVQKSAWFALPEGTPVTVLDAL